MNRGMMILCGALVGALLVICCEGRRASASKSSKRKVHAVDTSEHRRTNERELERSRLTRFTTCTSCKQNGGAWEDSAKQCWPRSMKSSMNSGDWPDCSQLQEDLSLLFVERSHPASNQRGVVAERDNRKIQSSSAEQHHRYGVDINTPVVIENFITAAEAKELRDLMDGYASHPSSFYNSNTKGPPFSVLHANLNKLPYSPRQKALLAKVHKRMLDFVRERVVGNFTFAVSYEGPFKAQVVSLFRYGKGGRHSIHADVDVAHRCISASIALSDPQKDFTGGEFHLHSCKKSGRLEKCRMKDKRDLNRLQRDALVCYSMGCFAASVSPDSKDPTVQRLSERQCRETGGTWMCSDLGARTELFPPTATPKQRTGTLTLFSSENLHSVSPVRSGHRYSLFMWIGCEEETRQHGNMLYLQPNPHAEM